SVSPVSVVALTLSVCSGSFIVNFTVSVSVGASATTRPFPTVAEDLPPSAADVKRTDSRFKLKAGRAAPGVFHTGALSKPVPDSRLCFALWPSSEPGERSHHHQPYSRTSLSFMIDHSVSESAHSF